MKKYAKLFAFVFFAFFLMSTPVFAREMTIEELGTEAVKLKEDTQYVYVIGKYAFTSVHDLTQQDIMLASRSIEATADDGYTNGENIYKKMNIQTIVPEYGNNFEITGWKNDKNLVGNEQLPTNKKFDIRYIDYEFYAEKSETKINIDVDDVKYSTYKDTLRERLQFETKDFYGKEKLTLKDGKLSGLLLKNNKVSLSPEDKNKYEGADYFFAYILEVPNANENVTIKVTNLNGTKTITWDSFDVQSSEDGKTPGVVILVPVNKTKWENDPNAKTMTIVVDADGDGVNGKEYAPTTYTIDLGGLTFQGDSKADLKLGMTSKKDKDILDKWGYKSNLNEGLKLDTDGKLTGKLVEQDLISAEAFGEGNKDGYYFDFTFELPKNIDLSKISISQLTEENTNKIKKTFQQKEYDENGNLTVLFRFAPETETGSKLYYSVDLDGNGEDYLPTIYTIDCTGVTFVKESKFTITGVNKEDADENDKTSWNGWAEEEGYKTDFQVDKNDPHKVKVTGLLPIFNQEDFTDSSKFSKKALYYLAFKLQTELGTKESSTINVEFIQDDSKTLQKENFKDEKNLYALKCLDNTAYSASEIPAEKKKFDITLDWDGEKGEKYAPYTITVDWSELKLQSYSKGNLTLYDVINSEEDLNKDSEEVKELAKYNYNYKADSEVDIIAKAYPEKGIINQEIKGTIKEQTLDEAAGFKNNQGYFVPIKIYFPAKNNYNLNAYAKTWTLILNTEDNGTKEYKPTEKEYDQGWVLVLFKIDENGKNGDKTIKYKIDFDGTPTEDGDTGYDFLPQEYTIKYDGEGEDALKFVAENKVTYIYKDNTGAEQTEVKTVYEGEQIGNDLSKAQNTSYRTFDSWYDTSTKEKVETARVLTEHENITLKAHWKLNTDEFVKDVIADLNSSNTTNSNDFTGKFNLQQSENNITIKVVSPKVSLTELAETSIPGTIAYVLKKGEIQDITLTVGNNSEKFTKGYNAEDKGNVYEGNAQRDEKLLGEDGIALKKEIIEGAKNVFDAELSDKEDKATLDQLEYVGKTFSIEIGELDETVTLANAEPKKYTFNFDSDFAVVNKSPESGLGATDINSALGNVNNYSTIYIDGDYALDNTLSLENKSVTIKGTTEETTLSVTSGDFVVDVKSGTVNISDLKLSGGKKAEVNVEKDAIVTANNIDIEATPEADEAGFEVAGTFTGTNLHFENETYNNPIVKVLEDDKGKANVTLKGAYIIENYMKVTKHTTEWQQDGKNSWSDEYEQSHTRHYYLNRENAKNYVMVGFMDERYTTVIRIVEKGKVIDVTTDFNETYTPVGRKPKEDGTTYKFDGWEGPNGKVESFENEKADGDMIWYYAIYSEVHGE